jgi:hypothetical protein
VPLLRSRTIFWKLPVATITVVLIHAGDRSAPSTGLARRRSTTGAAK